MLKTLDKKRLSVIVGTLLGDGGLQPGSTSSNGIVRGNARFGVTFSCFFCQLKADIKIIVYFSIHKKKNFFYDN
ncbi:MAG: hypothetical protein EOP34_01375 [Rickettsiales bacterium]|nr:MAG: hypothetical protein EOP34_01375 [Rickettsiales bacterium]